MELNQTIENVIPGIINFNRIPPNSGAAFGIFQGQTWFLITVTCLIMVVCVCMLIRKTFDSKVMFWALSLVLSGGVGNLIDRVFRGGNVVDFLEFAFFDFPVFNIADCAVCIGAGLIVVFFVLDLIKDTKAKKQLSTETTEINKGEPEKAEEQSNDN
jgi:signal peptidase II